MIEGMTHGGIMPSGNVIVFKDSINEYDGGWWNIEIIVILMIIFEWECIQGIRDVRR